MQKKIAMLALITATLTGTTALASTIDCKVTGVETWITATGHHEHGPTLSERKTESEQTRTRVFENVIADHTMEDGKVRLVTSGEARGGRVVLNVLQTGNPAVFRGIYTDGTSGVDSTVPVQCAAKQ